MPVDIDYWGDIDHPIDDPRVGYTPDLDVYPVEEVGAVVTEVVEVFADAGSFVDPVSVSYALSINELVSTLMPGSTAFIHGHESFQNKRMRLDVRDHAEQVSDRLLEMLDVSQKKTVPDEAEAAVVRTQFFDAR